MFYLIYRYLTISFFKFKSQDSIIITKDDFLKYIVLYFFQKGKGGGGVAMASLCPNMGPSLHICL